MNDFIGNPVKVGDLVASTPAGYCELRVWTIIKVNPKTVQLERTEYYTLHDGTPCSHKQQVRRSPSEFVKVYVGLEVPEGA